MTTGQTTGNTSGKLKIRTFTSDLKKYTVLAAIAASAGLILVMKGWASYHLPSNQPPYHPDPMILLFCFGRIGLGCILLLTVLLVTHANWRKSVIFTPVDLTCKHGNIASPMPWNRVILTQSGKKPFRTLIISDGQLFFRVEEFFFADFETIVKIARSTVDKGSRSVTL